MAFKKALLFTLFTCVLFSGIGFSLQQIAGTFSMDAFNGTQNHTSFKWIVNDGREALSLSVSLSCKDGSSSCDFIKYVKVEPAVLNVQPYSYGYVKITAEIPSDHDFSSGSIEGYLFAQPAANTGGQVNVNVAMGKLVSIKPVKYVPPEMNSSESTFVYTPPVQVGAPSGPLGSYDLGFVSVPRQVVGLDTILLIGMVALLILAVALFYYLSSRNPPTQKKK